MIRRNKKIILSLVMTSVFSAGLFSNVTSVKANDELKIGVTSINPLPQEFNEVGNGFTVDSNVNIIGSDKADEDAVRELKELLKLYNISFEENNIPINEGTNIYIGEIDDGDIISNKLTELNVESADTLEKEGYVLVIKDEEARKDIVLSGKDNRGTFYAVQTLEQLIVKDNENVNLPEVEIRDYPSMELRGGIEGFYGAPWSHEDRLNQIRFYGENKMNTYIYAPKDDPYHRDKWDEPYPESELNRMQELIDTSIENEVDFVFAISPGGSINLNSEEHYKKLIAKLESMYDMGVRSFAVFFDDISNKDAMGQSKLLNRVQREFIEKKGDCNPLIMVPQEYSLPTIGSYTDIMGRELDENIIVMWTGNDVVPPTITVDDLTLINEKYNRKMFIWWNFPVNDYCQDKLLLGPAEGLDLNLDNAVVGLVSNPMNESECSMLPLYTTADYTWNTNDYNRDKSWENAIKELGGEAAEALKIFTDHSRSSILNDQTESFDLKPLVDSLLTKWQDNEDITKDLEIVKNEFEKIEKAPGIIREKINNEKFIAETDAYLTKLELFGKIGQDVINMIEAQVKGDINTVWQKKLIINKGLKEADDMRIIKWKDPLKVTIGSKVVEPFIRNAVSISDTIFNESINGKDEEGEESYTKNPISSFKHYENYTLDKMVDGNKNTYFWSNKNTKIGDYIGIDLTKVEKINNIYLQMDNTGKDYITKGQLEYSLDGENWNAIEEETTDRVLNLNNLDIEARYLRYRATEDTNYWLKVYEFDINVSSKENLAIYTNINEAKELKVSNDGSNISINGTNTSLNLKTNDYIGVNLDKYTIFDSFNLDLSKEFKGSLQYSVNGKNWNELSKVNGKELSYEIPYGAKYLRIVAEEAVEDINLNSFNLALEAERKLTPSTNLPYYDAPYKIEKMVDGNEDTFFWASRTIVKGDYVKVDLGKLTNVRDVTLIMGHKDHASDYIQNGQMEYSIDGNTWHAIGGVNTGATVKKSGLNINARYLRYVATDKSPNWATFCEFKVNTEKVPAALVEGSPNGQAGFELNQLIDKNLLTAYKPANTPSNGEEIIVKPIDERNLTGIHIFQETENICNGEVQVKDKDGNWVAVGKLNEAYKDIKVDSKLEASEIKVVWDENGDAPIIYEIMPQYTEEEEEIIEKPNKPSNFIATALSNSSIKLNWNAPSNVKIKEYIIYKDGKEVTKILGKNIEFTVSELKANTLYGFKIVAVGIDGQKSRPIAINKRTTK
ncbi:beta-N-acetylglucosaminidase domain-containing protein [Clostridium tarantellae]|uniref:Hyaluronidase n=1 Tax=Clostridium tarantellae TaxID=39493 RepID=A0A6I1MKU6_9CLOT|nr:beta-N-acetylglucosaminidase domain-containing protein [Clostridium tarantellae]MPQ43650.1 hypothetical protein [Clostridium tarantellae]